MRFGNLD